MPSFISSFRIAAFFSCTFALVQTSLHASTPPAEVMDATIEIFVWHDADGDGEQEIGTGDECGEEELDTIAISFTLLQNGVPASDINGNPVVFTNTGGGIYSATGLAPGDDYTVVFSTTSNAAWQVSTPHFDGTTTDIDDMDQDSDFSPSTSTSPSFSLTANEVKTNIGLGVWQFLTVGGTVFFTNDCNVCDYEPGVGSGFVVETEVRLISESGLFEYWTLTDDIGKYSFATIPPGDYSLELGGYYATEFRNLSEYQSLPFCGDPNDDTSLRNDSDGTMGPLSNITMSNVRIRSGCEPMSNGLENTTFDFGLCQDFQCDSPSTDLLSSSCLGSADNLICDFDLLDNTCHHLSDISTSDNPPCLSWQPSIGNSRWVSFVAPIGDYSLSLTAGNCDSETNWMGIQAAIYTDCDFSEAVECFAEDLYNKIVFNSRTSNGYTLIPGRVYHLVVASFPSSCDVLFEIEGNWTAIDDASTPELVCTSPEFGDQPCVDTVSIDEVLRFEVVSDAIDLSAVAQTWTITPDDGNYEVVDGIPVGQNEIETPSSTFEVNFFPELDPGESTTYEVCWTGIESSCNQLDTELCRNIVITRDDPNVRLLTGVAFVDANANGIKDTNEVTLPNVRISFLPTPNNTILTDEDGRYSITTYPAQHKLRAYVNYGVFESKFAYSPELDTETNSVARHDFGFVPTAAHGQQKMIVGIGHNAINCARSTVIRPVLFNNFSEPLTARLEVYIDTLARNFYEITSSADSVVGNVAYFTTELTPGESFRPQLSASMPGPEFLGELIDLSAVAVSIPNNQVEAATKSVVLRCSYDPNDKQVFPSQTYIEDYTADGQSLFYTIRFQNTGNDYAKDVLLVDVLPEQVDPTSVALVDHSHSVTTEVNNDTLTFFHKDIQLIDSLRDPVASIGFVSFTVDLKEDLSVGTSIENDAAIYFDNNPPIITNIATHEIVDDNCEKVRYGVVEMAGCPSDFTGNLSSYRSSGIYRDTIQTLAGCDSVRWLDLSIASDKQYDLGDVGLCRGASLVVGSTEYTSPGDYNAIIDAANGCDSIITFSIHIEQGDTVQLGQQVICPGEAYEIAGNTYNEEGSYQLHCTNSRGCDSTVVFEVTIRQEPTTNLGTIVLCAGESYNVGDTAYDDAGDYRVELPALASGCDSIVTFQLEVVDAVATTLDDVSICQGETYELHGLTYSDAGDYTIELTASSSGCDSLVSFRLEVLEAKWTVLDEVTVCAGETYTVGGITFAESGEHEVSLTSSNGCDSTVVLSLMVRPPNTTSIAVSLCPGDSVSIGGDYYTGGNTVDQVYTSSAGCDSTLTYNIATLSEDHPLCATVTTEESLDKTAPVLRPNPVTDVLYIGQENAEAVPYSILTINGQVTATGTDRQINVRNLAPGYYIIRTTDPDSQATFVQRFIKL